MIPYLLDTDWVIHYLHGHTAIVERLDVLQPQGLALSIISLAELYEGVYFSRDPEGDEHDLHDFLRGVTVLGIDAETAKIFARERGRLRAAGQLIGDADLFIAATALQQGATLLTNNRRHFERVTGLRIESI